MWLCRCECGVEKNVMSPQEFIDHARKIARLHEVTSGNLSVE
jgi:hypothetical protein